MPSPSCHAWHCAAKARAPGRHAEWGDDVGWEVRAPGRSLRLWQRPGREHRLPPPWESWPTATQATLPTSREDCGAREPEPRGSGECLPAQQVGRCWGLHFPKPQPERAAGPSASAPPRTRCRPAGISQALRIPETRPLWGESPLGHGFGVNGCVHLRTYLVLTLGLCPII